MLWLDQQGERQSIQNGTLPNWQRNMHMQLQQTIKHPLQMEQD